MNRNQPPRNEIDLLVLLKYLLLKWRQFLIVMVVFAVLFDGYNAVKSFKASKVTPTEIVYDEEYYESLLTSSELSSVQTYMNYMNTVENTSNYLKQSMLMNIDTSSVPTSNLLYKANNVTDNDVNAIVSYLDNNVLTDSYYSSIAKQLSTKLDAQYIKELVTVSSLSNNNNNNVTLSDSDESKDTKYINISVVSNDEKLTKSLAKLINKQVKSSLMGNDDLTAVYLISNEYTLKVNNSLLSTQKNTEDSINSTLTNAKTLYSSFTDDQKAYYTLLSEEEFIPQSTTVSAARFELFNLKYTLMGLLMGCVILGMYYVFLFLYQNKLSDSNTLKRYYRLNVFGTISSIEYKGIDKVIDKIFNKQVNFSNEDRLEMIVAGIEIVCKKEKYQNIYITSTINNDCVNDIIESLKSKLSNIKVDSGKSVLYDPTSLEKLSSSDAVVIIEKVNDSYFNDIISEMNSSNEYKVPVIGAVVVE